ncbi:hypothetical protein M0R45_008199 [Rubus argutus]|uniref:Uncharacterized protein n=1 Tax=Rubus argutus TaxID=59490 RepID=A0AAW1Y3S4_RUBAR
MVLNKSFKLSYVKIRAQYLNYLGVLGCHDSLKATINTPNLVDFDFRGYIKSRVSISASDLLMTRLILEDKKFSTFNGPWKHFATMRDFLKSFGCSKSITLSILDFKVYINAYTLGRSFWAFYPPLPGLKHLVLSTVNLPIEETENTDLKESLAWMSHSTVEFVSIGL